MLQTVLIYGLVNSVILALVALGFSLTYGISGVANLAHGLLYILAGYVCWQLAVNLELPYFLSIIVSIIVTAGAGALIYRFILQPVKGLILAEVISTFALAIGGLELLRYCGLMGFRYKLPAFIEGSIEIGETIVDYQRLIIVAVGLVMFFILWLFAHFTKLGLASRGISQNEQTAQAFGIKSTRIAMLSVAFGSALAAVAALAILPRGVIATKEGHEVLIYAIAVGIVGGMESVPGIIVAAFLLGLSQSFANMYLGTQSIMIVYLLAIILVLAFKPSGLFGKFKELEERV
jgi:branched-chain amino acid transport system permease protein